jgi:hypothetical protein
MADHVQSAVTLVEQGVRSQSALNQELGH